MEQCVRVRDGVISILSPLYALEELHKLPAVVSSFGASDWYAYWKAEGGCCETSAKKYA